MLKRFSLSIALCLASIPCFGVEPATNATPNQNAVAHGDSPLSVGKVRASKLIGMKLVNRANENVGTISDRVIDSDSGQVEYAAISFGGILGLGDKWFAVPMEAIKSERFPNSSHSVLVLNVDKEQMKGAVGFDESSWPNFADEKFTNDLYRRFELKRRSPLLRNGANVDINVGNGGVNLDIGGKKP